MVRHLDSRHRRLQLSLTARVDSYLSATSTVVSGQATVTGSVTAAPAGAPGLVTSIFPGLVTPGAVVSLLGAGLSDPNSSTQVLLQGQPLSLTSVDVTQVKAVIPAGVNANERQQLVVVRGNTLSAGIDVQVTNVK